MVSLALHPGDIGDHKAFDRQRDRDLRTLVRFVTVYCQHHHQRARKPRAQLTLFHGGDRGGTDVLLCASCVKLLAHAIVKRANCPLDPKPACKHCPSHCYHPKYRKQIQEVMRFSGRKILLSGRLDYLFRLFF